MNTVQSMEPVTVGIDAAVTANHHIVVRQEQWVSHETIYRSLFVQAKGALKQELTGYLRTRRVMRRPHGANKYRSKTMGQLRDVTSIRERPAEAEDRAVPGHWEGDLICGKNGSAVATLVERSTRFAMLVRVERIHSQVVAAALRLHILTLPKQLRRSLTWDRGIEMARHVQLTVDTGVAVYFCDPERPWQRGTNENTNGLIRQYLPSAPASDLTPKRTSMRSPLSSTDDLVRPSDS